MKITIQLLILLLLAAGVNYSVFSSTITAGDEVNIEGANENVYTAAGKVIISGPVDGDLFVAGGEIRLGDSLLEDGLLAGGKIYVDGPVRGDLRIAGGDVEVNASIGGDLVVGAGSVRIGEAATIFGDLIVGSGNADVYGTVKGNTRIASGAVYFYGSASGPFEAHGGRVLIDGPVNGESVLAAENLELGENARFGGNVRYWSGDGEMDFGNALTGGATATYDTDLKVSEADFNWKYLGLGIVLFWLLRIAAAFVMIVLLIWPLHRFFKRSTEDYPENYINKFGWGILYLIGTPVLILVLFVTIIGCIAGLTLLNVFGLSILLGHILAAILGAYEIQRKYETRWSKGGLMAVAAGIYLGIKVLTLIPFLGWLISLIIVAIVLGHLLQVIFGKRRSESLETEDIV